MKRYLEIKPGSISETIKRLSDDYQAVFKAELEKAGKGLAQMTDAEKKAFFNKIDKMHNAKSEMAHTMPAKKLDDTNSTMVVKPGAPAGQEKVIRIPKEKLADYKSKGYVEAESYIPEAKKIDELTAGQKKLPPALQKAIKAKEKKEEVDLDENISQVTTKKGVTRGDSTDLFYKGKHIGYYHKITKNDEGKIGNYFVYHDNDAPEDVRMGITGYDFNQSDEVSSESQAKKIAYDSAKFNGLIEELKLEAVDLKLLKPGNYITVKSKEYVVDKIDGEIVKASDVNGDFKYFKIKDIEKIQSSYSLAAEFEPEDGVDLDETEGGSGGGIDALRAIKGKRLRLQGELDALNKDDPQYKEKKAAKQKEIEAQKEIMARKQREVYGSFDPSIEDALDLYEGGLKDIEVRKGDLKITKDKRDNLKDKYNAIMANAMQGDESSIADQIQKLEISIKKQEQELIDIMKKGKENQKNEAVDPERVANLQKQLLDISIKLSKIDRTKPENKTKEAILKADAATKKLRLQDLIQKSASDMKKAVNEMNKAKQSYKSLKMSLKKEQEINGKKKTLTDKPLTKIEVNPKIEG